MLNVQISEDEKKAIEYRKQVRDAINTLHEVTKDSLTDRDKKRWLGGFSNAEMEQVGWKLIEFILKGNFPVNPKYMVYASNQSNTKKAMKELINQFLEAI